MKMPSEAELIEMERRFDYLLEIAKEMRGKAEDRRLCGYFADAGELETDATVLEVLRRQAGELVDLAREVNLNRQIAAWPNTIGD